MITAERRPSAVKERPRPGLDGLRPPGMWDGPPTALGEPVREAVVADALEPAHADAETGLLLAFVVTTLVMVAGVVGLAVLQSWWLLVPVVLVHWIATYVILARVGGLLSR